MRGALVLTFAAALLACGPARAECRPDQALFRTAGGQVRFTIEIADDAGERAAGLMGRKTLSRSAGMLFIYESPRDVAFWMKNTPLPLDMIFIDPTGRVAHVHENAVPFDETPIPGGADILMVLEINGGLASQVGIAPGAELTHPRLPQDIAAFPCE